MVKRWRRLAGHSRCGKRRLGKHGCRSLSIWNAGCRVCCRRWNEVVVVPANLLYEPVVPSTVVPTCSVPCTRARRPWSEYVVELAASAGWQALPWCGRCLSVQRSVVPQHWEPTGDGWGGMVADQPAQHFRSAVGWVPTRRRASEMWTLGWRGGSDVTGTERQNIVTLFAGRGSAWPVVHHMTSVLSAFSWSVLDFIQLATLSTQLVIWNDRALTLAGRQAPYTCVSWAYWCADKPWSWMRWTRSTTYIMKSMRPSTEHWGTLHSRRLMDDLILPRWTHWDRLDRYDRNQLWVVAEMPNVVLRRLRKMLWSTVSNAADKSSRTSAATSPQLTACKMSSRTRSTAVSVECLGRKPDCIHGSRSLAFRYCISWWAARRSRTLLWSVTELWLKYDK